MNALQTRLALTTLLLAVAAQGEVLYEKEGVALSGSIRMIHRDAAICQVLEESESPEAYEQTRANHGRPLHVWRLDYSALNGSGQPLSDLTAHFQIEAQWPPCTNWTGLGQYPGPVQWAGSFETIQRTSGMQPGEEAAATAYVLAIDGQLPRFGRRQVTYRFGAVTPSDPQTVGSPQAPSTSPALAVRAEPEIPSPTCTGMEAGAKCWLELTNQPGCYAWTEHFFTHRRLSWTGDCDQGVPNGSGTLRETWRWGSGGTGWYEATGHMRDGKEHGRWVGRGDQGSSEGEYVDGQPEGHWVERYHPANASSDSHYVEEGQYLSGKREGLWVLRRNAGSRMETPYRNGLRHGRAHMYDSSGKLERTYVYVNGRIQD